MGPSVSYLLCEGKNNTCLKELGRWGEFLLVKDLAWCPVQSRYLLSGDQCQLLLFPTSKAVLGTRPLEVVSRGCPYSPAVLLVSRWRVGTWVGKAPGTLPSEIRLRPPSVQPKWKLLPRDGHLQMWTSRREPAGLWGLRAETGLIGGNYTERFHLSLRKHVYQSKLANRGLPRPPRQ